MTSGARISGEARRAAIIKAAREVFIEKGFHRTTTRELAVAAGVSEALLFKHFPNKEALYAAIQMSCFEQQGSRITERVQSLEPSTAALVFQVEDLVSRLLATKRDDEHRVLVCLILRSLMESGDFARLAIHAVALQWVAKLDESIAAARAAGDMIDSAADIRLRSWCSHHLTVGMMLHFLPDEPVIDYGIPREEIVREVAAFCLRGIGLKEEAIRRVHESEPSGSA